MSQQSNRRFVWVVLLVVVIAVLAIFFLRDHNHRPATEKVQTINYKGLPVIGDLNAPNQILAVEDLKCHGCMVFNNLIFPELKKAYIDTGKASYHVLLVGFLPNSEPAANTAFCLNAQNPSYFFNFLKAVYANQPPETDNWATPAKLIQFARLAAPTANFTTLGQCMLANTYSLQVNNNIQYGAKLMGDTLTTPTLFINGQMLNVQPSVESIKPLLK